MKFILSILSLFLINTTSIAAEVSGRWVGTYKLSLYEERIVFNTSFEVEQSGNYFFGILSLRNNNKGNIIGCDYLIHGEIQNEKIKFRTVQLIQNYGMSNPLLASFNRAEGAISFDEARAEIKASVYMGQGQFFGPDGKVKLIKEDNILQQLSVDQIQSFKKQFFPDSTSNYVIQNANFRNIGYPKKMIGKPIINFKASSKNNPAVNVSLYFDGIKLEEWSSAQDNYVEMDLNGLGEGSHVIVLKVETRTNESVSFTMQRPGIKWELESIYTISADKQLILMMYLY